MAKPTPSPSQTIVITTARDLALAGATAAQNTIVALQAAIVKYQDIDNYAKSVFDWYSDNVIRKYEFERRYIDGQLMQNPIVEQDLLDFINLTGRLANGSNFNPLRISEFDGTPLTATDSEYELAKFPIQDIILDKLQNGISGLTILVGVITDTTLDNLSTSVELDAGGSPLALSPGDKLLIKTTNDSCIIEVVSSTQGGSCAGEVPPGSGIDEATCLLNGGTWTPGNAIVNFTYLIPPFGTLPIGSQSGTDQFNGFNNTERTNKVPINTWEEGLMNSLLTQLETVFNERLSILALELISVQQNESEVLSPNVEINISNSISSINGFLGLSPITSIDISDTGITNIDSEKILRSSQCSSRITEIDSEITSGDYYNKRYNQGETRCRLNNGTIVQLTDLNNALSGAQSGSVEASALAAKYTSMLS